jgi:mRNA interferase RelE/StbE
MAKIVVHRRAARYLRKLPAGKRESVKLLIRELEKNPADLPGVRRMVGEWKGYLRLRAGNLRIIYWLDEKTSTVFIDHIGPRGDIYK